MIYLVIIAVIVAIDQALKFLVVNNLGMAAEIPVINDFFYINCIENHGIAMGMLANRQSFVIIFTGIMMLAILIYIFINRKKEKKWMLVILSVIVGGGIGNIIDRIRLNYVIDYIDFRIWPYIFNFADICVVLGCFALFIFVFMDARKENIK
ncbi:MAG: signal peptidase II [Firmicutes bacterium]|nr:signal peptidase II [Bacillota bacterium]